MKKSVKEKCERKEKKQEGRREKERKKNKEQKGKEKEVQNRRDEFLSSDCAGCFPKVKE